MLCPRYSGINPREREREVERKRGREREREREREIKHIKKSVLFNPINIFQ